MSFADLGVSPFVINALAARGITEPFPIQKLVMADALAGRDVWAKSPTGSGKTLGFGIPIIERVDTRITKTQALILVPTRELAVQVHEELAASGGKFLRVAVAYGGVGLGAQAAKAHKAHILVATPGRLNDLLERNMVSLSKVRMLVLDEADRMLDMGFAPQVDRIVSQLVGDRQTLLFSATLDGEVGRMAKRYTREPAVHEVASPKPTVELVDHHFVAVKIDDKIDRLMELLGQERGLALVFVRTKHGADRLAKKLTNAGCGAVAMHGNLNQNQRERALKAFESGRSSVLVATDVAARGLDLDDITHVVNFDPPIDDKTYVHRVGRTARAGRGGTGITFVTPDEVRDVAGMAQRLKLGEDFERSGMRMPAAPSRQGKRPGQHKFANNRSGSHGTQRRDGHGRSQQSGGGRSRTSKQH